MHSEYSISISYCGSSGGGDNGIYTSSCTSSSIIVGSGAGSGASAGGFEDGFNLVQPDPFTIFFFSYTFIKKINNYLTLSNP
jgi:hypothetical protein